MRKFLPKIALAAALLSPLTAQANALIGPVTWIAGPIHRQFVALFHGGAGRHRSLPLTIMENGYA
jgi:hypothetical protein